ncbi:Bifunctional oligoribonuclease/PAP phosphatase NrnA [[Mycoplasma] cavipharyngis]|uniref:DHH family phosphoesterase n=1 Tax=[Mycoplasma] cavipharyngis TaxID=92757 RepID=UPI003703D5F9
MNNKALFYQLAETISEHDQIVIFHHTRPDGDCLGAQFGLLHLIKDNFPNKQVLVFGNHYDHYSFFNWKFDQVEQVSDFSQYLAIVVDVNSHQRIEYGDLFLKHTFKKIIRFDHHDSSSNLKIDLEIDDPSYGATCELLTDFALSVNWNISEQTATFLYLGIVTDTGNFCFSAASIRTFAMAYQLIKNNANKNWIYQNLKQRSLHDLQIQSEIINNVKCEDRIIYYYMDLATQKKLGINSPLKANLVHLLNNIESYQIWIYFTQENLNQIRCEFRSNQFNVKQLAEKWNGGGHIYASGCMIDTSDKIALIVADAKKIINNQF